jgi:hypothetical protein
MGRVAESEVGPGGRSFIEAYLHFEFAELVVQLSGDTPVSIVCLEGWADAHWAHTYSVSVTLPFRTGDSEALPG